VLECLGTLLLDFHKKLRGRHVEGVLVQNPANHGDGVRPQDIHYRLGIKLRQIVDAHYWIIVFRQDEIESRFVLNDIVDTGPVF